MRRTNTASWLEKYNRWQIKVQKDGERRTFTSSTPGRKGQRECNAKADAWLDDHLIEPEIRVDKLFEQWLEILEATTGTSHHRQYSSYWNSRIKRRIGRVRAGALTEQLLQNVIDDAVGDGLARKTIINIRACMVAFCKYARKCKATALVPENLTIPKCAKAGEREILQPDNLKILFDCDKSIFRGVEVFEHLTYAWRFQVLTGLRPGELIGLQWSDIDLKKKTVSIKRSVNDFGEETTGKNDNARRTFIMIESAKQVLLEYKGKAVMLSRYVFPSNDGSVISQTEVYNRWIRYKAHNGIKADVTPYELRHTFVSIFKDLPEGLIKPIVGHSVDMDSYGTYGHELDGDLELAANLMQARLDNVLKK